MAYTSIIGIPDPPSPLVADVDTLYGDGSGATYDFGAGAVAYPNAGWGPYTHYVDPSDPNSTDTANEFGTPAKPRKTIPLGTSSPGPGSVVEIHGTSYTLTKFKFDAQGTEAAPVFYRGIRSSGRIELNGKCQFGVDQATSWCILENIKGRTCWFDGQGGHHLCIRDCEFTYPGHGVGSGVAVVHYGGNEYTYVVIYDNDIHDYWSIDVDDQDEDDQHAVGIEYGRYIWVLNNDIYHCGGDSVQCRGATIDYVYIGANSMYSNGENAIDLKECNHIVISENDMYDMVGRKDGDKVSAAIVTHNNFARYTYILFNTIHHCSRGISNESGYTWAIGNTFYDIRAEYTTWEAYQTHNPNAGHGGWALVNQNGSMPYCWNNTFYDCDGFLFNTPASSANCSVVNNIFAGRREALSYDINFEDDTTNSVCQNNLFDTDAPRVVWNSTYTAIATLNSSEATATGNVDGDADFVSAASANLSIQSTSDARDAGLSRAGVNAAYLSAMGQGIAYDKDGTAAPQGDGYDIGAYEYIDSDVVNLHVDDTLSITLSATATVDKAVLTVDDTLSITMTAAATTDYTPPGGEGEEDTFGYTGAAANENTAVNGAMYAFGPYSPDSDGSATSVTILLDTHSGNDSGMAGIYANNAGAVGAKLGQSAAANFNYSSDTLHEFTLASPVAVSAASSYWVVFQPGSTCYFQSNTDAESPHVRKADYDCPYNGVTMPAWEGDDQSTTGRDVPSYVTYTTEGEAQEPVELTVDDTLSITMDATATTGIQLFIRDALYLTAVAAATASVEGIPVRSLLGNTTLFDTEQYVNGSYLNLIGPFTMPERATLSAVSWYIHTNGVERNMLFAVFADGPDSEGALLGVTASTAKTLSSAEEVQISLADPKPVVEADADIWLAVIADGAVYALKETTATIKRYLKSGYTVGGGFPSALPDGMTGNYTKANTWVEYTPSPQEDLAVPEIAERLIRRADEIRALAKLLVWGPVK